MLDSYFRGLGVSRSELRNDGANITVGIADTFMPDTFPDWLGNDQNNDRFPEVSSPDPMNHGSKIFNILYHYLPAATFNFYRIIGGPNKGENDDLIKAIEFARNDGVDLLNISGGSEPVTDPAAISNQELGYLLGHGITVVSACGNFLEHRVSEVQFPANLPDVVGVAGYQPYCDLSNTPPEEENDYERYAYGPRGPADTRPSQEVYCGYAESDTGNCTTGTNCTLTEEQYEYNVPTANTPDKPDAFAPVRYPYVSGDSLKRKEGTSFATPVVTAVLGRVLDAVHDQRSPSAPELRRKLKQTGVQLTADHGTKPNADQLLTQLLPAESTSAAESEEQHHLSEDPAE